MEEKIMIEEACGGWGGLEEEENNLVRWIAALSSRMVKKRRSCRSNLQLPKQSQKRNCFQGSIRRYKDTGLCASCVINVRQSFLLQGLFEPHLLCFLWDWNKVRVLRALPLFKECALCAFPSPSSSQPSWTYSRCSYWVPIRLTRRRGFENCVVN